MTQRGEFMRTYLKEFRENLGLSQDEVSKKLCLSRPYYSRIELGKRQKKLSLDIALKLSEIFNVPITTILENEKNSV